MRKREWNISQNNGGYVGVYSKYESGRQGQGKFRKIKAREPHLPDKIIGIFHRKKAEINGIFRP